MNYVVDKVKGGVKRGCVHFDTPSLFWHLYSQFLFTRIADKPLTV